MIEDLKADTTALKNEIKTRLEAQKVFAMNNQTKYRIIKLLIYVLVGFAVAFLWHQMKK